MVVVAGCATLDSSRHADSTRRTGAAELQLENLGLVYDDTIVTQSARTVDFNGQAVVPRFVQVKKSGGGRDLSVSTALTKVVFGLREDVTLAVTLPYVSKRLEQPGGSPTLRSEGLGDTPVVAKYRFYQRTGLGETTEAAAIFGLELPTGRDGVSTGGVTLPPPLQPGSGSLDAILGGAFTRIRGRWLLNADLLAKVNSEANDYRFGTVIRADVGGHYRAYPARYERYDQPTLNLVAELNGVWSDRDSQDGTRVDNSGGTVLFVTPGLQFILNQSLLFEGAVQLPVVMDLNGTQLEQDYAAILGLRIRF